MKILLTGSTGYIGKRLLQQLLEQGHEVVCMVRNLERLMNAEQALKGFTGVEIDLLNPDLDIGDYFD